MMKIYRNLRGGRWMRTEEVTGNFMEEMGRNKGELARALESVF